MSSVDLEDYTPTPTVGNQYGDAITTGGATEGAWFGDDTDPKVSYASTSDYAEIVEGDAAEDAKKDKFSVLCSGARTIKSNIASIPATNDNMEWKITAVYQMANGFTADGTTHAGTSIDVKVMESSGAMANFVAAATALATLLVF